MTIARKLNTFLTEHHADFELIAHEPTHSSRETASVCRVPAWQMAKAVLLDTEQDYLLAVLPTDRRVELAELRSDLGTKPRLVDETRLVRIFDDCEFGALPALGSGYGVATIIDDSLDDAPDIYFEAGDHASLVHMSGAEFGRLTSAARRGHFSDARPSPM
ncbi:MAG: YbaK/EbsC family protein [Hyphomonadaceae bacterium]|nr:YbaK/EbsC family protein [Hyphomonadaceae bacterium]